VSARSTWCALAGVDDFEPLQVVVRPEGALRRAGWVGIVRFEDTLTVLVPDERSAEIMRAAFVDVSPCDAVTTVFLPPHVDTLGPADVFFAVDPMDADDLETGTLTDIAWLLDALRSDELAETGIADATSSLSIVRVDGAPVAACAWHEWPHGIAHLGVLTHPDHRGRGHAQRVGRATVRRAQDAGLVPQWRARVDASKEVARRIGLAHLATQLSVQLD
jgi:GNAT superfamily N-acetyltransferase